MSKYLLAAEADQIQSFVFRSAKLREVRGASQMLDEFCKEAPMILQAQMSLQDQDIQVISHAGGAFRIVFSDESKACEFERYLVELYRRTANASMSSVVIRFDDDFVAAQNQANLKLREVKLKGRPTQSTAHLPHIAFCASCGIELAVTHTARHADERANYVCESCLRKAELGLKGKREGQEPPDPADAIAEFDPKNYVAYLKADGNSMGKLFGQCNRDELGALSEALDRVMRSALIKAEDTAGSLLNRLREDRYGNYESEDVITPLLLAGDDCFALIPAPWALDFARRFCLEFEKQMQSEMSNPPLSDLKARLESVDQHVKPTMTAVVVICKRNYPYTLAHERAERLLKAAKKAAKDAGHTASMLDFEVILGNEVQNTGDGRPDRDFITRGGIITLRPYWAAEGDVPKELLSHSLSIERILEQRLKLAHFPANRIAQMRALFDVEPKRLDTDVWRSRWQAFRDRLARFDTERLRILNEAWRGLGDWERQPGMLMHVSRFRETLSGHGLADLTEMWDYSYRLDEPKSRYIRRGE